MHQGQRGARVSGLVPGKTINLLPARQECGACGNWFDFGHESFRGHDARANLGRYCGYRSLACIDNSTRAALL